MNTRIIIAMMAAVARIAAAQAFNDPELARMLSDGRTREAAVASIVAAGAARVPSLLSWTRTPPRGVDRTELYVGMAEAFGALRTKEAIPFLVQHISIEPWISSPDVWAKPSDVMEERLPAVGALIRIGPEAAKAILSRAWDSMGYNDRLAALVVLSRVGEGPEARRFILAALGEANLERERAQEALTVLDKRTPPAK